MLTLEERIIRSNKKTKQLETQKKIKDKRECEARRKLDVRRNIKIGKIVSRHFPAVLTFQPHRTEAENDIEFALLDAVLSLLAKDKHYVSQLVENGQAFLSEVYKE